MSSSEPRLSVLAVVPARGGSKSIPRKNLKPLAGHPLIAYSIAAGLRAASVDAVLVSTDDEEIREAALAYGAQAPFLRPAELARDDTPDLPVFLHALGWLERHRGYRPDLVVQLRPTSPLRPPGCVDEAVALLSVDAYADALRSVSAPSQNPYKMWRISSGYLSPLLAAGAPEAYNMPRQALPPVFWQTGHLDVMRPDTLTVQGSMTGRRIAPFLVDPRYAVDIDTEEQWRYAEWLILGAGPEIARPGQPERKRAPQAAAR